MIPPRDRRRSRSATPCSLCAFQAGAFDVCDFQLRGFDIRDEAAYSLIGLTN